MKELFTDLYKKVAGFFQAAEEKENVKEVACNRLKFVLMQDRTNLNPQLLERMRGELIDLLSKYVEMDKEALELNFEQEGESMALMLSIPVIRAKDEEEIHALIKAEEDAKAQEENEDSEESEDSSAEINENVDEDSTEADEETEVCACGCNEENAECTCGEDCDCDKNEDCENQENTDGDCEENPEEETKPVEKKSKKKKKI